ncbi:MAG: SulP family inorganic anion transporter [Vicinamibacterales bacterium]
MAFAMPAAWRLVVLGLTGLGAAVRCLPKPIVVGFTNGVALLIAVAMLPWRPGKDDGREAEAPRPSP